MLKHRNLFDLKQQLHLFCMKKLLLINYVIFLIVLPAFSQKSPGELINQLKKNLANSKNAARVDILNELATLIPESEKEWTNKADSQMHYATLALNSAEKIGYKKGIARALVHLGESQRLY